MNKKYVIDFPENYTVLDIETTGLSSLYCEIIEIGALCVRSGSIADEFSMLVKPYKRIPPNITAITGITEKMVENAERIDYVLPEFLYFAGNDIIVGHNVNFDLRFIKDRAAVTGVNFNPVSVDTMKISRILHPEEKHHRLCDLADRYHIINKNAHRALNDCYTTHKALQIMKKEYESIYCAGKQP